MILHHTSFENINNTMQLFDIRLSQEDQTVFNQIKIDKDLDPFRFGETYKWSSFDSQQPFIIVFNGIKNTSRNNSDELANQASTLIS